MNDHSLHAMSNAARTLFVFGLYAILAGTAFVLAPAAVLSLMHLPPMPDGWARLIGLLAWVIGIYDIVSARTENRVFIKATVFVRLGFAAGAAGLFLAGQMPAPVLLLGTIDAAGAVWTARALWRERAA